MNDDNNNDEPRRTWTFKRNGIPYYTAVSMTAAEAESLRDAMTGCRWDPRTEYTVECVA